MSDNSGRGCTPLRAACATVDHLNRLVQIAGSTRWISCSSLAGNIVYDVSLAGCGLPPFESGG